MDIKSLWQVGSEMALFMFRDCATLRMLRTITEMLLLRYVRCVKPLENWLLISQFRSLERESCEWFLNFRQCSVPLEWIEVFSEVLESAAGDTAAGEAHGKGSYSRRKLWRLISLTLRGALFALWHEDSCGRRKRKDQQVLNAHRFKVWRNRRQSVPMVCRRRLRLANVVNFADDGSKPS